MARLHAAAAAPIVSVVRGIDDAQLDLPTPCREFDVAELLNHCFQVTEYFTGVAYGENPDMVTETDYLIGDWREGFASTAAECATAFAQLDDTAAGADSQPLPPDVASAIAASEMLVHGWDLARATGQTYAPSPAVTQFVMEFHSDPADAAGNSGGFAAPITVPSDAPALDRLLGKLGRDPRWESAGT